MDLDLPQLEEELGEASGSALGFLQILDRMPQSFAAAGFASAALAAQLTGTASSFDVAAYKLTGFTSKTSEASKTTLTTAQKIAQAVPAALSKIGSTAAAVGGVVKQALTGDVRGALTKIGEWAEQGIGKLQERLAQMGPYGQAAAAALGVLTAAVSATVGTMLDLMGAAIKIAETKAGLAAAWGALAGGKEAGAGALAMIGKLSESLPYSGSQLRQWGQSLLAAGVPAGQLEGKIKAIAAAEALMAAGQGGGGAAAEELFKKLGAGGAEADAFMAKIAKGGKSAGAAEAELKKMGLTFADFGGQAVVAKMNFAQFTEAAQKALQVKGAGPLQAAMSTWPVILDKAKGGFMSLFGGLGPAVEPFMQAVKKLFSEFNAGSPIIRGLKPIVTSVFGTLFFVATSAVNAIHKGFLMVAIGAIMVYIKLRPLIAILQSIGSKVPWLQVLKVVLLGIAGVAAAFVGPFLIGAAMVGVLIAALAAAASYLQGWVTQASDAASNFVAGLVGGITAGAGAFVDAVKSLAQQGMSAFTSFFGIKSPSTKMLKHGEENIAGAATTGVDKGTDKFQDAMANLGGEPPKGGGRPGGAGAKVARTISVTIGTVVTPDARTFVNDLYGELERMDAEALT